MKKLFTFFSLTSILSLAILTTACSQVVTLQIQHELVYNDPDFKTYVAGVSKSMEQTKSNYYGFAPISEAELSQIKNNEEMVALLRSKGMKNPEEYVELHHGIFQSYKNLVEKHEFLKKMTKEERDDFFKGLKSNYPDVNPSIKE
jgi:hypothetical protein